MRDAPMARRKRGRRLLRDEEGAITVFGLFIFTTMAVVGGIAIDVTHLYAARTQLQVTADAAAHGALYARDTLPAVEAKEAALALVEGAMPAARFGTVVADADIEFGSVDPATGAFAADPDARGAVRVTAARLRATGNAAPSFLFRMVGRRDFDVRAQSVFVTHRPPCLREGFVAQGVVDMQSNNEFWNGFCIHSNSHVEVNSNNVFEDGTVVSMPDTSDLVLPNSGFETNIGLEAALRSGAYAIRLLNDLAPPAADPRLPLIDRIGTFGSDVMPDYITASAILQPQADNSGKVSPGDFTPGHIHHLRCKKNSGSVTFEPGLYSDIVVVAPCALSFNNGAVLENAVFATWATEASSVSATSGFQVGRDDSCAADGGAQIVTMGGMSFPADLRMYGGQLVAGGDIDFAANADGIEGASMIAGGRIDGTSNMAMGFCGTGMEDNLEATYFRLAG